MIPNLSDRYKLISLLGEGHFGKTYKALDRVLNRNVIIKTIHNDLLWNELYNARNMLLAISCEQIVKIIDIVSNERFNFIVQEYIDGVLLSNYIAEFKYSLRDFLNIAISICKALEYLNSNKLAHKDVKPANIIYNPETGIAVLIDLDFVNINLKDRDTAFVGTLMYSAPEQITNNLASISGDIYSLGLVLYQLIKGSLPFKNTKEGILEKTNNRINNINLNRMNSFTCSDRIFMLISKMMSFNPQDRVSPDKARLEFEDILDGAKSAKELDLSLRTDDNKLIEMEEEKKGVIVFNDNEEILNESIALFSQLSSIVEERSNCWTHKQWEKIFKSNDNARELIIKKVSSKDVSNKTYQNQLIKEYDSILFQAKVTFWLWVVAFIVCYAIIAISIVLICMGRYQDALVTVILQGLIYAVQRLFAMREDHYREIINKKIKHLEIGDYLDYAFEKLNYLEDIQEKNKKVGEIIDSIRRQTEKNM